MEYNKLNIFYLALTEKECFRLPFQLSFERFSLEARLPAGVQENEPALKRKSPRKWNTNSDKKNFRNHKKSVFGLLKNKLCKHLFCMPYICMFRN